MKAIFTFKLISFTPLIYNFRRLKKVKIDNKKTYCFYFCNVKTTIVKCASSSEGKSYFDHQRARKPTIDNDFGIHDSFTGELNQSRLIDPSDEESEYGIRNPAYDILRGRKLPELPVETQRPNSSADSVATYATMPMRSFNSSRNLIAEYDHENREIEDSSTEQSCHQMWNACSRKLRLSNVGIVLQNLASLLKKIWAKIYLTKPQFLKINAYHILKNF